MPSRSRHRASRLTYTTRDSQSPAEPPICGLRARRLADVKWLDWDPRFAALMRVALFGVTLALAATWGGLSPGPAILLGVALGVSLVVLLLTLQRGRRR